MSVPPYVLAEILMTTSIALGIPLIASKYNRTRGREPSDREKRILLIVLSTTWFISSFFVDNPWGLFDDAFVALRPVTSGTTIGLSILLLWYIYVHGWIGPDDESRNQQNSTQW